MSNHALIRGCVGVNELQNCFAGLDCKLVKHAEPERSQIRVSLDPVYKKYRADGVSAANCVKLLDFLRKGVGHPAAARGAYVCIEQLQPDAFNALMGDEWGLVSWLAA